MSNVIFFSYAHHGDLFAAREYLAQARQHLGNRVKLSHDCHPRCMEDLGIEYVGSPRSKMGPDAKSAKLIADLDGDLWINICVDHWRRSPKPHRQWRPLEISTGINPQNLRAVWQLIFRAVRERSSTKISIRDHLESYLPSIDYEKFGCDHVDRWLTENPQTKILIANGAVQAKQSQLGDLCAEIQGLSQQWPQMLFVVCDRLPITERNVVYTDDITARPGYRRDLGHQWTRAWCDLPEISRISQDCRVILGKNSGPFVWTLTQHNLRDPRKIFRSWNKLSRDSLVQGLDIAADYAVTSEDFSAHTARILEHLATEP